VAGEGEVVVVGCNDTDEGKASEQFAVGALSPSEAPKGRLPKAYRKLLRRRSFAHHLPVFIERIGLSKSTGTCDS
jgi:ribosomal protein L18E